MFLRSNLLNINNSLLVMLCQNQPTFLGGSGNDELFGYTK